LINNLMTGVRAREPTTGGLVVWTSGFTSWLGPVSASFLFMLAMPSIAADTYKPLKPEGSSLKLLDTFSLSGNVLLSHVPHISAQRISFAQHGLHRLLLRAVRMM